MKTSKAMQAIVGKIASKHGVDISQPGAYLKLEMPGYQPLSMECIGTHQVAVMHTFIQEGDVMRDPEIVFFTGYPEWVAIAVTQDPVGVYREYAELSEEGETILRYQRRGQAELAAFANTFARNIAAQGWWQRGQVVRLLHAGNDDDPECTGGQEPMCC